MNNAVQNDFSRCCHLRLNGARCTMPALRGKEFCCDHERRLRRSKPAKPCYPSSYATAPLVGFAYMEDHTSILHNLNAILEAFNASTIDHRHVGTLTYLMNTALKTLRQMHEIETAPTPEEAVLDVAFDDQDRPRVAPSAPETTPSESTASETTPSETAPPQPAASAEIDDSYPPLPREPGYPDIVILPDGHRASARTLRDYRKVSGRDYWYVPPSDPGATPAPRPQAETTPGPTPDPEPDTVTLEACAGPNPEPHSVSQPDPLPFGPLHPPSFQTLTQNQPITPAFPTLTAGPSRQPTHFQTLNNFPMGGAHQPRTTDN